MESVTILRELWRRRLLVAIVGVLAFAVGYLLVFGTSMPPKRRAYEVGIGSARVLVDTPQSQVVEVDPKGSDTLGSRASVLANLMVDGELKNQIAQKAGLRPKQLIAGTDTTGGAAAVAPLGRDSYALTTGVVVNTELATLPLIKVETQAPTPAAAAKLADSAVAALTAYVDQKASSEGVTDDRRLRVSGLGPAQVHIAPQGTGKAMGLAAAIFVFLAGCTAILVISGIVKAWRAAAAAERKWADDDFSRLLEPDKPEQTPATSARL